MTFWKSIKQLFQTIEGDDQHAESIGPEKIGPANPVTQPLVPFSGGTAPLTPEETVARARWRRGMPVILDHHWEEMMANVDTADYNQMRLDLMAEYPTGAELALALFAWYGHGGGSWDNYPAYETVAEQLLWELPIEVLVKALEDFPLEQPHLEGAARLFSGDLFHGTRDHDLSRIPVDIRQGLHDYLEEIKESDKISRFRAVFGL